MNAPITVLKLNVQGQEAWRYQGHVLERGPTWVRLQAHFNRPDIAFMGILLKQGDRFVEEYYTDRWYNIFAIHDRDDDRLKGWYCNVARPAVWEGDDLLSYVDLALDLWVAPDGTQTVLDEDEFARLDLDPAVRARARAALEELQAHFAEKGTPGG